LISSHIFDNLQLHNLQHHNPSENIDITMAAGGRLFTATACLLVLQMASAYVPAGIRRRSSKLPYAASDATSVPPGYGSSTRFSRPSNSKRIFTDAEAPSETDSPCHLNNRHSASDWLHNVLTMPQSTVLREIRNPVFTVAIWSSFVSIMHALLTRSGNKIVQKVTSDICISSMPHSLLFSSLSLLLVFRTNTAYQRFAEGRKIWENILTVSRNMSRMMTLYTKEIGSERNTNITNHMAAFPYLLRHHIRENCLCREETSIHEQHRLLLHGVPKSRIETRHEGDKLYGNNLSEEQIGKPCWVDKRELPWSLFDSNRALKQCARASNRPLWVCDRIGREIMNVEYGPNFTSRERLTLLGHVDKLTNAIGECERIHQTSVPLNYARHSIRSLTVWLFTLPFAMIKDLGLLTGPAMAVIAWILFGVYQIGYTIEDPFQGSLRLTNLCDGIRRDVVAENNSRNTAFMARKEEDEEDCFGRDEQLRAMRKAEEGVLHVILPDPKISSRQLLSDAVLQESNRVENIHFPVRN